MRANKLVPVCANTLDEVDCPLWEAEPGRPLRGMLRAAVLPHRRPQGMRAVAEGERQLGATSCSIGSMRGGLDVGDATPAVALHTVGRTLAQQVWRNR